MESSTTPAAARSALARTATTVAIGGAAALALLVALVARTLFPAAAIAFAAGALPVWLWLSLALHRGVEQSADPASADATLPGLGAATAVTLVRGWLVSVVGGFLLLPGDGWLAWLPGPLYTAAALLDGVDGAIARRSGRPTRLGARLDVLTDAAGLLVAPLVAAHWQRLPPWYLLLAVAYPLFQAALRLRSWLGLPVFRERLRPDPRARFFAGVQMVCVATALYPVLPRWFLWPAATVVMMPTLLLFAGEWRLVTRGDVVKAVVPR